MRHRSIALATAVGLTVAAGATAAAAQTASSHARPAASADGPTGTLRVGTFLDATTFDPQGAQPTLAAYFAPVYDTLVRFDAEGGLAPGLATAWERTDAATWRFELRDDVVFHDGTAFDAEAVKVNIERARDTPTNPQLGEFRNIDEVVVVSPTEVTVHFSAPHPEFASVMAGLAGSMVSPAAMGEGLASHPVGSGGWAYNPAESQPGVRHVFDAFTDYWDPASQGVARVEVLVLSDPTARTNAFKANQVDIIDSVPPGQVADLEGAGAVLVAAASGQNSFFFVGDRDGTLVPALGDVRVRQALSYAMNREAYIENIQGGRGTATAALWPTGSRWWSEDNAALFPYDPDRARELLAEAGYADGLQITLPVFSTTQTSNEIAAQMLNEIGVELVLEPIEPGTAGRLFRERSYPMVWGPVVVGNPYSFWATFVSAQGGWNSFGVDTSAIDAVAQQAAESLDEAEQIELYQELERLILEDGLFMSFGQTELLIAVSPSVAGDPIVRIGERTLLPHGLTVS